MLQHFTRVPLSVVSRPMSASPATGSPVIHKARQQAIIDEVFDRAHGK
jgi:2-oxoglutarate dehydrogenase complex dehydrogenase (E1) component-like enzyme